MMVVPYAADVVRPLRRMGKSIESRMRASTLGQRVRYLRKHRGLTQQDLADRLGISQPTVSLIETDETTMPSGSTLAALCKALRTTPDFLVAGAGDPDSIQSAIDEHELVHVWRALPEAGRQIWC